MIVWLRKNFVKVILGVASLVMVGPLIGSSDASAILTYAKGRDSALDAIFNYYSQICYSGLRKNITFGDVRLAFTPGVTVGEALFDNDKDVLVPNYAISGDYSANSPRMKCSDFLFGNDDWNGIIQESGLAFVPVGSASDADINYVTTLDTFMTDVLNYDKVDTAKEDAITFSIYTKVWDEYGVDTEPLAATSNSVQLSFNGDNKFESVSAALTDIRNGIGIWFDGDDCLIVNVERSLCMAMTDADGNHDPATMFPIALSDRTWEEIKNDINENLARIKDVYNIVDYSIKESKEAITGLTTDAAYKKNPDYSFAFANKVTGVTDGFLSPAEMYNVYNKYLSDGSHVQIVCDDTIDFEARGEGWRRLNIKRNGVYDNTCFARKKLDSNDGDQKYNGGSRGLSNDGHSSQYGFTVGNMSLSDVIDAINALDAASMINLLDELQPNTDPSEIENPGIVDVDPDGGGSGGESGVGGATDSCQGAGGAGALGWIVCPIMEWMGGVATDAYNDFLKPQLQVAPELFANGQSGASYEAWRVFQGIANTIFSIILLIVIFSQLTGVGIDNYGIKRILPKLIIAAVATNLSYVICQLAVDLSNILGNSLQALFDSLAYGGNALNLTVDGIEQGSALGPTLLTGAVIAGILVIGGVAIWRNPAMLLSLLVGLIGAAVAILFIFILLAARQAAILILVVISPLAFVCYALPNTKKMFDKWLKMMQGLLVVYPICGLLIGGGNFASRLLLASGQNVSFLSAFVAMLVSIVPLFFVPTVLKNSMSALGGLGGKISGIGKGLGGRAQGAVRNSRGFKDAQKRSNARGDRLFDRRRAGIHIDRDGNVRNNRLSVRRRVAGTRIGRMMGWDAATGAAQAQYVKEQMDRQANINTFNERGIIDSQVTKAQNAEDERIIAGQVGVARNTVTARENIRQKADDERAKAEMEMDIKAVPMNRDNLRTRLINQVKETMADNAVPVIPVDVDLAIQRKQSATKAQELKNFTDQFASLSKGDLQKHADELIGRVQSTGAVSGSDAQMMQALISTMESRGMEGSIAKMLEDGGSAIGSNSDVMQTLAGSKNRVFKAYGKGGAGLSYQEFMSGTNSNGQKLYRNKDTGAITTNANGNVSEVGMAKYARDKGSDFINDLDDKALAQISKYQEKGAQIMSGDMIAQAQARVNSQDAVDELDKMMKAELDAGRSVNFSAAQFANLNDSTRQMLFDQGAHKGNMDVARNLLDISDEMVRNADLRAKLGDRGTAYLDVMRATRATVDGGDHRSIRETVQANQQAQQGQQGQQTS